MTQWTSQPTQLPTQPTLAGIQTWPTAVNPAMSGRVPPASAISCVNREEHGTAASATDTTATVRHFFLKGYKRFCITVNRTPSHSYRVSFAIPMRSHSVTCHPTQVNTPRLTPARQAYLPRFTYPGGMEGWVDLGARLHTEIAYPPTDGHPSKY